MRIPRPGGIVTRIADEAAFIDGQAVELHEKVLREVG